MPDPGSENPRRSALKLLKRLRATGPVTMTDLLKNFLHLKKRGRDALLERLGEDGLVRIEGRTVVATSYQRIRRGTVCELRSFRRWRTTGRRSGKATRPPRRRLRAESERIDFSPVLHHGASARNPLDVSVLRIGAAGWLARFSPEEGRDNVIKASKGL